MRFNKTAALGAGAALVLGNLWGEGTLEPAQPPIVPMYQQLGHTAGINLIAIDVLNAPHTKDDLARTLSPEVFWDEVTDNNERFLNRFSAAFRIATNGRYVPEDVSVTTPKPINLPDGCLHGDEKEDGIREAAERNTQPGKLNIVLVNAPSCGNKFDGYADETTIPVVTRNSFGDYTAPETAVHEAGHYFGLPHAGIGTCVDQVRVEHCMIKPEGDRASAMAYTRSNAVLVSVNNKDGTSWWTYVKAGSTYTVAEL